MTTRSTPIQRAWCKRWDDMVRVLLVRGDWLTLLAVIGLLSAVTLSLHSAGLPLALPVLLPTLIFSVLAGFALARSSYNEVFALLVSGMVGALLVLLLAALGEAGGLPRLGERFATWVYDGVRGALNQDEVVLTVFVALLFWFFGYNAMWHLFRVDRVWRVIVPPGLVLVVNAVFYSGTGSLDVHLGVFLFLSLLLIVRSHLDAREWDWYVHGIHVPLKLRQQFLAVGVLLSLVTLVGAWSVPQADLQSRLTRFQEFLQNEPLQQLAELWTRLFASTESFGPAVSDYFGGDSLELGGAIRLGDDPVFWVAAPNDRRYYWRSRVFDTYESGRWTSAADIRQPRPDAPFDLDYGDLLGGARQPVQQQFTMGLTASRLIYAAPQPYTLTLPVRLDVKYMPDGSTNLSVIRPIQILRRAERYTVTSMVSVASADQLRAAGTAYPQWVSNLYLYLSPSVTSRTIDLARQIVANAGAVTPYDQAKAIERWLRANVRYNELIPQPPPGRDPVDWLLFDMREGYCNYYASAMIVMLRSVGIPARLAAGFAQGTFDPAQGLYVVLERDAHTWVEAYFPGYGWIEFEPTAAQAPLDRSGDSDAQLAPPSVTPPASPTATLTPTPSPTLPGTTPTPLLPDAMMSSSTPTPRPTSTATPIIAATQPPQPPPPRAASVLDVLLPALGVTLGVIVLIVLLVLAGVFLWWWWEWRGMGGLSPIARAYARFARYAALLGLRFAPQQTPEERRRAALNELPPSAEPPVTAITRLYAAERYGRTGVRRAASESADSAWMDARSSILTRLLRRMMFWRRGR